MNDQDLIDSLSEKSPLERAQFTQTMIDVVALITGVGLVLVTGLGLAFCLFYLFLGVG